MAKALMARELADIPMTERLPVNRSKVISGTGRTKLRMSWLMTSAFVVSGGDNDCR